MLARLALRDFVLAREIAVELEEGFCALTGETGAGKSLLVEALALLAGGRASASVIRPGAKAAEVEAAFWTGDGNGGDGDELIVRRIISRDAKKSRAFINGRHSPLAEMAAKTSAAVEICGQHAHYSLLKEPAQRRLLDGYAGAEVDAEKAAVCFRNWRANAEALKTAKKTAEKQTAEREELQRECAELNALGFTPQRWKESCARLLRLEHSADLAEGCAEVLRALEESGGAEESLAAAGKTLARLSRRDEQLKDAEEHISAALQSLQEGARALRSYAENISSDPRELAECEEFVSGAHALARKHRLAQPSLLAECLAQKEERLAEISRAADIEAARKQEEKSRADLQKACKTLSQKRERTARKLEQTVAALLPQLAMREARLWAKLIPLSEPGASGAEKIELLITTRKGAQPDGIRQVASGGELSRLGLALQIAGGDFRAAPTVVFDEVDSGVGGAAAAVVGSLLKKLGRTRQVLCVTHLAQVAACADWHWRVQSSANGAEVLPLDEKARVEEIARMSGGEEITAKARAHAAELRERARAN